MAPPAGAAPGAAPGGPGLAAILDKIPVIGSILGGVVGTIQQFTPRLDNRVTVEVIGQPGATKKQLYLMALAAANGIVRRYTNLLTLDPTMPPPYAELRVEYDAADHWVRCILAYNTGTFSLMSAFGPTREKYYSELAVYNGPQCNVVGGEFGFTSNVLRGLPDSSDAKEAPKLEFKDRTILTPCPTVVDPKPGFGPPLTTKIPSPNPKPPGDNRSRGAVIAEPKTDAGFEFNGCCNESLLLIPLVFAALSDPGSLSQEVFPAPVPPSNEFPVPRVGGG